MVYHTSNFEEPKAPETDVAVVVDGAKTQHRRQVVHDIFFSFFIGVVNVNVYRITEEIARWMEGDLLQQNSYVWYTWIIYWREYKTKQNKTKGGPEATDEKQKGNRKKLISTILHRHACNHMTIHVQFKDLVADYAVKNDAAC